MIDKEKLEQRQKELSEILLNHRNEEGYWTGKLSSSALGVSVACVALHFHDVSANENRIKEGMSWLAENINSDGGFGDTPNSFSNISTSLLCYSSIYLNRNIIDQPDVILQSVADYLNTEGIDINSKDLANVILNHYQTDRTFSVPILAMCALCGIPQEDGFEKIPQLPFELALLPKSFYRVLNLSVVSYAIPALVAVGIAIFKFKKNKNWLLAKIRNASINKSMKLLENMMPDSGGFLEAIPLTAFVTLCLMESGFKNNRVVAEGIDFLKKTQRTDGSWPIDVDLSTWVTSLSVKSMRSQLNMVDANSINQIQQHYVKIQNKDIHPFNSTAPGGWGWTNFSGSVPDGDDTPGAILTMLQLSNNPDQFKTELFSATNWLLNLQNMDGGFPTFAKGWGKLPFDQSCADLTGHALLSISKMIEVYSNEKEVSIWKKSVVKSVNYLLRKQKGNGALLPLWFGNQHTKDHSNPVYGTARVISYLNDVLSFGWIDKKLKSKIGRIINTGLNYLVESQNDDGSWGGDKNTPGSIEETALVISALSIDTKYLGLIEKAFAWLDDQFDSKGLYASPIGLYFASLWYDEEMYPITAYNEAVNRVLEVLT